MTPDRGFMSQKKDSTLVAQSQTITGLRQIVSRPGNERTNARSDPLDSNT